MTKKYLTKDNITIAAHKSIYLLALVYIIYYMVSSLLSSIGLISNGINSIEAIVLLFMYIVIIAAGIFVVQIKFRYELVFAFALLVQFMY